MGGYPPGFWGPTGGGLELGREGIKSRGSPAGLVHQMGSRDGCCVVCVGSIFRRYLVDQTLVSLGVSRKELEPSDVQYMPCCGRSIHHSCVRAWFGFLLSKNCLVLCPYCHDRITGPVFRHGQHCLPNPSWHFTLMKKELPALLRCLTTGNSDKISKRLLGIFSYLTKYNMETKTLPPPEPIELRAMICCGLTKEMLPLPTAIKIHPSFDFLKILLTEADIVPDDDIHVRPVFKVYGRCEQCQKMLRECPTDKDVGLSATEVMYVMMPPEWSDPIDWQAEGCS